MLIQMQAGSAAWNETSMLDPAMMLQKTKGKSPGWSLQVAEINALHGTAMQSSRELKVSFSSLCFKSLG